LPGKEFYAVRLTVDGSGGKARPAFVVVAGPDQPQKARAARDAVAPDGSLAPNPSRASISP
jgi:hypothetical protein